MDLNTVVKSFKKCGISNSMDGTEECLLWEGTSDPDEHENDWDPYGVELHDILEEHLSKPRKIFIEMIKIHSTVIRMSSIFFHFIG